MPVTVLRDLSSRIDRTRSLRGAVCGAVAAAVWALQQPLDKVVFGCPYDDVELLGRAVSRDAGWYSAGLLLHNRTAPCSAPSTPTSRRRCRSPLCCAARRPPSANTWRCGRSRSRTIAGIRRAASCRRWPATARAFAQATSRHLLFGFVLGELERRLNAEPEPAPPQPETDYTSNGHGSLEHGVYAAS